MAKRNVTQLRYFGDSNFYLNNGDNNIIFYNQIDSNQPSTLTANDLSSGDAFANYINGKGIIQLGIQALPGTKFNLNANLDPIIIGTSGMYELDLTNSSATITTLTFDKHSLDQINKNPDGYLIVDIVYQEG